MQIETFPVKFICPDFADAFAQTAAISEYESLRLEIQNNSTISMNLCIVAFSATAMILGYALANKKTSSKIFLAPFAIIIPSLLFIGSQIHSTARISEYLKTCERPKYFGWEPWLLKEGYGFPDFMYSFSILSGFILLGAICVYLCCRNNSDSHEYKGGKITWCSALLVSTALASLPIIFAFTGTGMR